MFGWLLDIDDVGPVTYAEPYLRHPWPRIVVLLLVLGAIGYAAWIYRRERALSRVRRIGLGALRAGLYAVIVVLLFEPVLGLEMRVKLRRSVLVLLDASESMGIRDRRASRKDIEEAALALGKVPFDQPSRTMAAQDRADVATASRLALAKGVLDHPELNVFRELAREHKVRYFCFGERLEPTSGEGEVLAESLGRVQPAARKTLLGSAIREAINRYSGQPVAGVVLLTDGASNGGIDPREVARRCRERNIPLFPIGFGLSNPPDVRIQTVSVHDVVLFKDQVSVYVQLDSTGYAHRTVDLTLKLDGERVDSRQAQLSDKPQFEELTFIPKRRTGLAKLEVEVETLAGESSAENNRYEQEIRVIDEKIRVLYVEGKPRWEYRYLRRVLLRDPQLDVKFLMTEGDRDLPRAHDRYLATFPEEAAKAYGFDLVILGDVPAGYFAPAQLERMEQLVRERGGSLLMLAGEHYAPRTYHGTPIADVLPVRLHPRGREPVGGGVHPVLTDDGRKSTVVALDADRERNAALWRLVKPLYSVPALEGKKAGAYVLLTLPDATRRTEPYPLVAWHRYGSGKALFVGTDQLWRLRFKRGDTHHLHFWGQTVRFLTISRLLGDSKPIRLETPRKTYRTGEHVHIIANVLNESFEPVKARTYTVRIERVEPEVGTDTVTLERVEDTTGGLYQGFYTPEKAGSYRLRPAPGDQESGNVVEFTVATAPLEQLEPAMQEARLAEMAQRSGGRYFTVRELPELPDAITGEQRTTVDRREKELWDLPLLFVVLLGCAGTEWFFRRRYDLI